MKNETASSNTSQMEQVFASIAVSGMPRAVRATVSGVHVHHLSNIADTFRMDLEAMPELEIKAAFQIGIILFPSTLTLVPRLMCYSKCDIVPRFGSLPDRIPVVLEYWPNDTIARYVDASERGVSLYGVQYHQGHFMGLI